MERQRGLAWFWRSYLAALRGTRWRRSGLQKPLDGVPRPSPAPSKASSWVGWRANDVPGGSPVGVKASWGWAEASTALRVVFASQRRRRGRSGYGWRGQPWTGRRRRGGVAPRSIGAPGIGLAGGSRWAAWGRSGAWANRATGRRRRATWSRRPARERRRHGVGHRRRWPGEAERSGSPARAHPNGRVPTDAVYSLASLAQQRQHPPAPQAPRRPPSPVPRTSESPTPTVKSTMTTLTVSGVCRRAPLK